MTVPHQQVVLTALIAAHYQSSKVTLRPISPYIFEDRGIYHVDLADTQSYILRAFRYDVAAALLGQAAVLTYLEQYEYPAPHVIHTKDGAVLATYQGWTALMLSFIEGTMADFSPATLTLLGACAGSLHTLSTNVLTEINATSLPNSRLHPTQISQQTLEQLSRELPNLPNELQPFYEASIQTIQRMQQATPCLPTTIIHGDCWPHNAILTENGHLLMIDWDGAGLGPAILDIGYLLLTCHLGKPQLPAIQPTPQHIAAVVHGYCQQRRPTPYELSLLTDAIFYDSARRAILDTVLPALSDNWHKNTWLQKLLARRAASEGIATIAKHYFELELS